jgi:hypothetical protein
LVSKSKESTRGEEANIITVRNPQEGQNCKNVTVPAPQTRRWRPIHSNLLDLKQSGKVLGKDGRDSCADAH